MQQARQKSITLIVGGARSGKSRFAQRLAADCERVTFLATAGPVDDEMREKIERHRKDRPPDWVTVEVPVELDTAILENAAKSDLLLLDCLTIFVANALATDDGDIEQVLERVNRLCGALRTVEASVVLVSNEVGSGVVPAFASGRVFRDLLGEINQKVAMLADNVLFMVAGLPLVLKGQLGICP
jgi:adenosylcobinamide kinase/adenosylcobinamide-phosphate guanylyltransferase